MTDAETTYQCAPKALMPAGRKVLDQAVSADATVERQFLAGLTRKDGLGLVAILRKLLARLEPTDPDARLQG